MADNVTHEDDEYEYDDGESDCRTCRGEGWVIIGLDIDNNDPLWHEDGAELDCPNCGGSGMAKDMTFW